MNSRVFSVDLINHPDSQYAFVYRTSGRATGGHLGMYQLTPSRLIRLLRAMVNVSTQRRTYIQEHGHTATWTIYGLVGKAYAVRAAVEAGERGLADWQRGLSHQADLMERAYQ